MNTRLKISAAFALLFAAIPLGAALAPVNGQAPSEQSGSVLMLSEESGRSESMTDREYIIGSVFASLPADSPEEALKAQAVLASTYLERRRADEAASPTEELAGCLFSDDTSKYNAWFSEAEARSLYGQSYAEYYRRISAAADYAAGIFLSYDGQPACTPFHAESDGRTLSAEEAWGKDVPYLQSVPCPHDSGSTAFVGLSQNEMTAMAQTGSSCEDILLYFFKGCTIIEK